MKIQPRLFRQRTEIDVHRPTKTIPARKTLFLFARDIGERIADVLKIETDTASFQPRSFATPLTEKVAVRALTRLMAVRATESLLWSLASQIHRHYQRAKARASQKSNSKHSRVHSGTISSMSPLNAFGTHELVSFVLIWSFSACLTIGSELSVAVEKPDTGAGNSALLPQTSGCEIRRQNFRLAGLPVSHAQLS
jgi:hypothetical protein